MYELFDLGTLPGDTYSAATGVNENLEVIGVSAPFPVRGGWSRCPRIPLESRCNDGYRDTRR